MYLREKPFTYLALLISIILGLLLLLIAFSFNKGVISPVLKTLGGQINLPIKRVGFLPSDQFMNANVPILGVTDSVLDAIEIFLKENLTILPVLDSGRIMGIVTKKGILEKTSGKKFDLISNMKINEVIQKTFSKSEPDTNLANIYTRLIEKDQNGIVIIQNGQYKGVIDYFDILKAFNRIKLEIENPPILLECISKDFVSVTESCKLYQAFNIMVQKKSDYCLVTKNSFPIGIVTTKDLISALNKNLDFQKTAVIHIMSPNLISMTPGTSVIDAFNLTLEKRFNQIPVILEKKIVGIINAKYIIKAYYELLARLNSNNQEK